MALGQQHVLSFSPDGKLFAFINDQGILRIWDTETNELKQEYTPNIQLSGPCTALTWVITSFAGDGIVEGKKIERNLKGEGHSGKVTCLAQDAEGHLFSSGEDCQIIVWSLSDEKQLSSWSVGTEKPYSIIYLGISNNVVVGGRQIKVYSVATQELVQTFTGHTSDINLISSLILDECTEYVISTSRMERIICLWKMAKR
ncbi:unnamed protein product [Ceratitis capitata]|uniref:(Mediterranean fruit fly) hypothetical protein n=1 Tax=Ceratitis capitata TaxID=7213 RepID=A0A811V9P1_CERCA|nr:unnamed protein product [Ceratitis capitata]